MTKSNLSLKTTRSSPKTNVAPKPKCEFCKKEFASERTLFAHACEKKRRWMWRDEKYVRFGLIAFQKFYTQVMRAKTVKSFDEFMNSPYYTAFTKFGRHLLNINAIDPEGFIDFLLKKEKLKLDDWCNDSYYAEWVREVTRKESSERAIERNILLMEQWSREYGEPWQDFFRKISPQLATRWIATGRISPWLLYTSVGQQLLDRLSDEQLTMVKELINPIYWKDKFQQNREEIKYVEQVLTDAGC